MDEEVMIPANVNYTLDDTFTLEDLADRRIYIATGITDSVAAEVVYRILRYNRIDKDIDIEDRIPIIVYIDTVGGDCSAGFSIIDAITLSKTPVYTVNVGKCCSAGAFIFLAGSKRYSMPSATFLQHEGTFGVQDSFSKTIDSVEFERIQGSCHIKNYVLSRTNISEEQYNANMRKEWYFYPTEGKEIGYVHYIVGVDCDIGEIL